MLTTEKVVYVIKTDKIVPGHHCAAVSGGIYTGFQPHKWWLAGRFKLRQECVVTRHTVKAGQSMIIPAHFPHDVHSWPDTLSVHLAIEAIACPVKTRRSEVSCPDNPLLDCRVESDDHFGFSLHESEMDPDMWKSSSLNTRPRKTKSSGLQHYFEVKSARSDL